MRLLGIQEKAGIRRSGYALGALLLLLLLGTVPAQAAVTHVLAGTFNEGGTLSEPGAMAVDTSTGSVYVVTGGSSFGAGSKVEKFDASGNPSNFSFLGTNSFTPALRCIKGIAVDNSAGGDHGVIYIATSQATSSSTGRAGSSCSPSASRT